MRDYIPAKKHWFGLYTQLDNKYFTPVLKFPIDKITRPLDYPNEISERDIFYALLNFDREAWEPIVINKSFFLKDGQHRLEVAKQMGLSYIDVIIDNEVVEREK